jgi:hypothetical protein
VQAGQHGGVILAQSFHHPFLALWHDAHALGHGDGDEDEKYEA